MQSARVVKFTWKQRGRDSFALDIDNLCSLRVYGSTPGTWTVLLLNGERGTISKMDNISSQHSAQRMALKCAHRYLRELSDMVEFEHWQMRKE